MSDLTAGSTERLLGGYGPSPLVRIPQEIIHHIHRELRELYRCSSGGKASSLLKSLARADELEQMLFSSEMKVQQFRERLTQLTRELQEHSRKESPSIQARIEVTLELARNKLALVQKISEAVTSVHGVMNQHLTRVDEVLEYDHGMEAVYFELRGLLNSYYHEPVEARLNAYLEKARHFRSHFEVLISQSKESHELLSEELLELRGLEERILAAELLESGEEA